MLQHYIYNIVYNGTILEQICDKYMIVLYSIIII